MSMASPGTKVIAITGVTGFLGRHVVQALHAQGWSINAIGRPTSRRDLLADVPVRWCDHDDAGLATAVRGATAVMHLATCYGRAGESVAQVLDANLMLPVRLLAAAANAQVERAYLAGTTLPPHLSAYALAKHQAEAWIVRFPTVRTVVFDLQHFYGPGDDVAKFTANVMARCLAGQAVPLTEGSQERDFIYIDDVVAAISAILADAGVAGRIEIGSGEAVRVRDFVERVHAQTGRASCLDFGAIPNRPGEPTRLLADTTQLRRLGWQPKVSLEEGIARCLAALKGRV